MKIIFLIIVIIMCGCSKEKIEIPKMESEISINEVVSSSNSIIFKTDDVGLRYEIIKNDRVIKEGVTFEENIISDLEYDTLYRIIIYKDSQKKESEIRTGNKVTLRFGGDVMMTSAYENYIKSNGINYMWSDVSDLFNTADYSFVNLETSVSTRGSDTKPKGYGFRSNPLYLQGLVDSSIDMVSLSNNHVLDYGYDAFLDTMDNLNKYNISYIGAGKNIREASNVLIKEINGIKIGFFGASSIYVNNNWVATDDKGGIMSLRSDYYDKLYEIIDNAKDKVDYLIFIPHWGREHTFYPEDEQIELAHNLIDRGVDIIIGHHSHSLHGIEYYNDGIIYYSLGNFNFLVYNDNARKSGVFELNIDKDKIISSYVYPVYIKSCKANLVNKDTDIYNDIIGIINERSSNFGTTIDANGNILKEG